MGEYSLGDSVDNIICLGGRLCIKRGNVFTPLVRNYTPKKIPSDLYPGVTMFYPAYNVLGIGEELFVDVDPKGRHYIRKLVEK